MPRRSFRVRGARPLRNAFSSHAFASFQSRMTVSGDTFRTVAVSSTLSPPKKRSSTTLPFRSSILARGLGHRGQM